ncbi:MAG: GTPase HflX [Methanobacteriota archaeon]|nr:MAG: GTPase HflX [Euryarchaeota archaeon]
MRPPPHRFRCKRLWERPPSAGWLKLLLVSLTRDVSEITALVRSAGHELADTVVQVRDAPDRRTFVGKGKLEELAKSLEDRDDVGLVLFNGELHPSQHYHLEKDLKRECYDRLRLILEIFAERAHGREAKLQVELALLHYEVPILREWIHSAAVGERPGFMAGGEYRVDVYLETVKRRMRRIEEDLEVVRRERGRRRAARKDRGFHLVSLAGYANAGKSSMLNALTGERVLVEERMFSTLSTTTRALPGRRRVLLTDTVGFVDQVPFWMVEAFNSTFEEIYESDLILLLVDASDAATEILRKVRLAARTLLPRVEGAAILPVLTKADLVSPDRLEETARLLGDSEFHARPVATSTETGQGLRELLDAIAARFAFPLELVLRLPAGPEGAAAMGWLYANGEVLQVDYGPRYTEVRVRCRADDAERIGAMGRIVSRASVDGT